MKNRIIFVLIVMLAAATAFALPAFAWSPQLGAQSSPPAPPSSITITTNQSLLATNIIGSQVKDDQGETLGIIRNLVVSPNGDIIYALVSHSGESYMQANDVAVPWPALRAQTVNGGVYALNISKEQFDNAPTLNSEEFARMSSPQFEQNVYGYYGQPAPESGITKNAWGQDIEHSLVPLPEQNRNGEANVKRGG